MAESRTRVIAQALLELAESIAPRNKGEAQAADVLTGRTATQATPPRDIERIATLIRALCPPTAATTNANEVAALIRTLSPAPTANLSDVVTLLHFLSPAPEAPGAMEALIRALSPAEPEAVVAARAKVLAQSDVKSLTDAIPPNALPPGEGEISAALDSLMPRGDRTHASSSGRGLSPKQRQAVEVLRVLSPVSEQPKGTVEQAVEFLHAVYPKGGHPATEVASLIAALSPAEVNPVSSVDDAAKFIRGLCPAGAVPAPDVAELVRALSPTDNTTARSAENVAEMIRALCPATADPGNVAAMIRAVSPADHAASRPVEVAKLIRALSPAAITPVQVLHTLSPAAE